MTPRLVRLREGWAAKAGDDVRPLNHTQTNILWTLMCRRRVTMADIAETVWPNANRMPETWRTCISVEVCALRKVLSGTRVSIPRYSNGYSLEAA